MRIPRGDVCLYLFIDAMRHECPTDMLEEQADKHRVICPSDGVHMSASRNHLRTSAVEGESKVCVLRLRAYFAAQDSGGTRILASVKFSNCDTFGNAQRRFLASVPGCVGGCLVNPHRG